MAFEGLAQALLAGLGEVQNRRQRREEQRLRELQLEGLALENEAARRALNPTPEPTLDLGTFAPDLAGVRVSPADADDLLRAYQSFQPEPPEPGPRTVPLSTFLVGPRLSPYRDQFAGVEVEEGNVDAMLRALAGALPEPAPAPSASLAMSLGQGLEALGIDPAKIPQTTYSPFYSFTDPETLQQAALDFAREMRLLPQEEKERTYTMNVPTHLASKLGLPAGGLLTGLTIKEVGEWADRLSDLYEKNEPEAKIDLRDLLVYPGITEEDIETYRLRYGDSETVNTPSGITRQFSYLVPASTWNHLLKLHADAAEAELAQERELREQAQALFDRGIAQAREERERARFEQEQAATVTLGDLAEIAGFDVGRIPADVRNLNLKIGSTEGLVRSIETLQDMAEGEQSTASGIDAGDILRFATDVYNARYGFDFNAPPFDQFLVNEFPAVFDVANALARGEQPSEDSLRSVLGTDEAAGLAPAQTPAPAPQSGFNFAGALNSVAGSIVRWLQSLLNRQDAAPASAPFAAPQTAPQSVPTAPAMGAQAVRPDVVARPAEPLPFDPLLEAQDLVEQMRAEGVESPIQEAVRRLDADREKIKLATRWTDEQIDEVIRQLVLMGGNL